MKNRLAIIGANASISILIEKAKKLNYETHVFSLGSGEIGEKIADYFYPISIDKKDEIYNICKKLNVVGVCSITSDFASPTVNYVARKMGLPSNPEIVDESARNKFVMRKILKNANLFSPDFICVSKDFSLEKIKELRYPLIVKPIDRWSSKGVTRVNGPHELPDAVKRAISESISGNAIIEDFMEGQEYSAECICYNGDYKIIALTKKQTTGFPYYIESGHFQPADLSDVQIAKICETIKKALEALGIENGAAHVEFKISENEEIGIIEIGARMGGDCIGTDLTPISTGLDYVKMVIDVACGIPPEFKIVGIPKPVCIKFIINKNDRDEFNRLYSETPERIIRFGEFDEEYNRDVTDSSTRHGYYIFINE